MVSNIHLTTITDAMGSITNLTYNGTGQVTSASDPFGRQAIFSYDANGNLINITDMGGYSSSLSYDQNCFINSIANSHGTWNFYTEPADGTGTTQYPAPESHMGGNYRITITNPLGYKEEYFFQL
jgi:YD repeat-containing protein